MSFTHWLPASQATDRTYMASPEEWKKGCKDVFLQDEWLACCKPCIQACTGSMTWEQANKEWWNKMQVRPNFHWCKEDGKWRRMDMNVIGKMDEFDSRRRVDAFLTGIRYRSA